MLVAGVEIAEDGMAEVAEVAVASAVEEALFGLTQAQEVAGVVETGSSGVRDRTPVVTGEAIALHQVTAGVLIAEVVGGQVAVVAAGPGAMGEVVAGPAEVKDPGPHSLLQREVVEEVAEVAEVVEVEKVAIAGEINRNKSKSLLGVKLSGIGTQEKLRPPLKDRPTRARDYLVGPVVRPDGQYLHF